MAITVASMFDMIVFQVNLEWTSPSPHDPEMVKTTVRNAVNELATRLGAKYEIEWGQFTLATEDS
jgi:hypothetical protein